MLRRVILAVVIGVVTALVVGFVGMLLGTIDQAQIAAIGAFLKATSVVWGFLAGVWYFFTGQTPGI